MEKTELLIIWIGCSWSFKIQTRPLFADFLQCEFSLESLLFVEACLNYEQAIAQASDKARGIGVMIRDNFLLQNAPSSINISYEIRQRALKALSDENWVNSEAAGIVFEETKLSILKMMSYDSFSRFRASPQFQSLQLEIVSTEIPSK
eukprot:TRINITY_DN58301_c0_g2_i5.p1 TRINITY_DN58301_c0_g2~~TRINITY_DN58301_c0_g2_i5.p1  ORF type:complete len:148 (-),score=28.42 TRINITY_DN58301_c0_g2_i5:1445-1888(-)